MTNNPKKILLAFSSLVGRGLIKEIFRQLETGILIDYVANRNELFYYLARNISRRLPGLILIDLPPIQPDTAEMVEALQNEKTYAGIPIALFLLPGNIRMMTHWMQRQQVYFFPRSEKPSECKAEIQQMLQLYTEISSFNASASRIA